MSRRDLGLASTQVRSACSVVRGWGPVWPAVLTVAAGTDSGVSHLQELTTRFAKRTGVGFLTARKPRRDSPVVASADLGRLKTQYPLSRRVAGRVPPRLLEVDRANLIPRERVCSHEIHDANPTRVGIDAAQGCPQSSDKAQRGQKGATDTEREVAQPLSNGGSA